MRRRSRGLGRFAECEAVLDQALTAARAANDRRRITATLGSAPHAALWGPNPVSRAGGRCLDIVRLLRITTGSPAVEATSLRCQAVLEAFRGRADAARRMLGSARRTLSELGLEHELLEAEQFSGIVELVDGDAAAAEQHLRAAFEGFTKVGVDVLAAQSAARLARALLNLGEDSEAESFLAFAEQHGGQDLKTALSWRSTKAELLARRGEFTDARALAEEAVAIAERTDALIDHGIACRSLGVVLRAAGDAGGAREAEARALALFERKGATALIESTAAAPPRTEASSEPTPRPAMTRPQNAATRRMQNYVELFARRAWDEIDTATAPDCRLDDRRVGVSWVAVGASGPVDSLKAMADAGTVRIDVEPIATRGERLSVIRWTVRGRSSGGFETDILIDVEVDERDRVAALVVFGLDELDLAIAELDGRYAAQVSPTDAAGLRVVDALNRAANARDWEAVRRGFADDLVTIDHRPASLGRLSGPDAWIESFKAFVALVYDHRGYVVTYHRIEQDAVAFQHLNRGSNVDGGLIETTLHTVAVVRDGRIVHWEQFPIEDLEAALRRFDELASPAAADKGNAASRLALSLPGLFQQQDWAAFADLLAETLVRDDRRRGLRSELGREAFIESSKQVAEVGLTEMVTTPLAWRGERLVLVRNSYNGTDNTVDMFVVYETDEDGRFVRITNFDEDGFDAALTFLDERFVQGEDAADGEVVRMWARYQELYNARDWTAFAELLADGFVVVDHRLVSLDQLDGPDAFVRAMQALIGLDPGRRGFAAALPALGPQGGVATLEMHGATADGAETTETMHVVGIVAGGQFVRNELYPSDRLEDALRRLDELTSVSGPTPLPVALPPSGLENACVRIAVPYQAAFARGDFDTIRSMCTEDVVYDDRRAGLANVLHGRDAFVANIEAIATLGAIDTTLDVVAIRGERLSLAKVTWRFEDPSNEFEVTTLNVVEIDAGGLVTAVVSFDDHLDAAFDELDARFLAGEAAGSVPVRTLSDVFRSANAREWDRFAARHAEDVHFIDHRPAGGGTIVGRGPYIEYLRGFLALAPRFFMYCTEVIRLSTSAACFRVWGFGTTADGAPVELEHCDVYSCGEELAVVELFPSDRLNDAIARFDELTTAHARAESALENGCVRMLQEGFAVYARSPQDGIEPLLDWLRANSVPTTVQDDRRAGLRTTVTGVDALIEANSVSPRLVTDVRMTVVATRGDRLALVRVAFVGTDDEAFENEMLWLSEISAERLHAATVIFDLDDVDAAFAELDERFVAGEGAVAADLLHLSDGFFQAANARDVHALRALMTEDFAVVDHRLAGLGEITGREAWLAAFREFIKLLPASTSRLVSIPAVGPGIAFGALVDTGVNDEGGEVELAYYLVWQERDGLLALLEAFALEDLHAARARFDELGPRLDVAVLENSCVRINRRLWDFYVDEDWGAIRDLYHDGHVVEDLRDGLRMTFTGPDENLANLKALQSVGGVLESFEPIAIRGDRLALIRFGIVGPDEESSFDSDVLVLNSIDTEGRLDKAFVLDSSDVARAFAELDELYAAGEGTSSAEVIRTNVRILRAMNAGDWDTFRACLSDDFVLVDHRPASLGVAPGADRRTEEIRSLYELFATFRLDLVAGHAIAPDRAVGEIRGHGVTKDGAEVEISYQMLVHHRNGQITRMEVYPLELLGDALARFDELGRRADVSLLENGATRFVARLSDAMDGRVLDDFVALHSPSFTLDDRRAGLRHVVVGLDEIGAYWKIAQDDGLGRFRHLETLAIRGDRLALSRRLYVAIEQGVDFESERLVIDEIDEQGLVVAAVFFDPDDLDAAFDELDARFSEGEGLPFAEHISFSRGFIRALNAMDIAAMRGLISDDCVLVDHRPASFGELRAEEYLESLLLVRDLLPEAHYAVRSFPILRADASLNEIALVGTTAEGTPIEMVFYGVVLLKDGRATRIEFFDDDHYAAALARFHELTETSDPAPAHALENHGVRSAMRFVDAFAARDWDFITWFFADDCEFIDRRPGLQTTFRGKDVGVQQIRAVVDSGVRGFRYEPIAIRGERLVLARYMWDASDWEVEVLSVDEVDTEGRSVLGCLFAPEDLEAAFLELDARYLASDEPTEAVRLSFKLLMSYNARDWDTWRAIVAEDAVYVDHAVASAGQIVGRNAYLEHVKGLVELTPDIRLRCLAVAASTEKVAAHVTLSVGTDRYGGSIEREHAGLNVFDDGQLARGETWEFDRYADLLVRFNELAPLDEEKDDDALAAFRGPQAAIVAPSDALENACTRTWDAACVTFAEKRWDDHVDFIAEDVVTEDRRPGLQNILSGRDAFMEVAKVIASFGPVLESTVLAIRGDRLALYRHVYVPPRDDPRDHRVEALGVLEVDANDRIWRVTDFEPDDIDAATAELDERYLSGEGVENEAALRVVFDQFTSYNARDWATFTRRHTEDYVFVDHRPAGAGTVVGAAEQVRYLQALIELAPDAAGRIVEVVREAPDRVLARWLTNGTTLDGAAIELDMYLVHVLRNGRLARLETFPADQLDASIARFHELGPQRAGATGDLDTTCTRTIHRAFRLFEQRRTTEYRPLLRDDLVFEDRRMGLGSRLDGADQFLELVAAIVEIGPLAEENVLAVRGEFLALVRMLWNDPYGEPDPFVVETLNLVEVDASGRLAYVVGFDPADLDAAFEELDVLYFAGEGRPYAEELRVWRGLVASLNRHDWTAVRAGLADDFRITDRRAVSLGEITDPDEYVLSIEVLADQHVRSLCAAVLRAAPGRLLVRLVNRFRTDGGTETERWVLMLLTIAHGRVASIEAFEFEAMDAALARFDELAQSPGADHPCLRWQARREAAIAADDWASVAELYADDAVFEDHRSGLGTRIDGRDAVIEQARFVATGTSMTSIVLATRGARLALIHGHITTARGYEVEMLLLHELDESGRQIYNGLFDPDDLNTAFAELDTRYVAGEGAANTALIDVVTRFNRSINERRWDNFRDVIADDLVFVDHRPASLGSRTKAEWVDALVALVDVIPTDHDPLQRVPRDRARPLSGAHDHDGTNPDDADVEIGLLTIALVREGRSS